MLNQQLPDEEAFANWKSQQITQLFFKFFLPACEETLKDQWAHGEFNREALEETAMANASGAAQATVYRDLQELSYAKFIEVLSDEQS